MEENTHPCTSPSSSSVSNLINNISINEQDSLSAFELLCDDAHKEIFKWLDIEDALSLRLLSRRMHNLFTNYASSFPAALQIVLTMGCIKKNPPPMWSVIHPDWSVAVVRVFFGGRTHETRWRSPRQWRIASKDDYPGKIACVLSRIFSVFSDCIGSLSFANELANDGFELCLFPSLLSRLSSCRNLHSIQFFDAKFCDKEAYAECVPVTRPLLLLQLTNSQTESIKKAFNDMHWLAKFPIIEHFMLDLCNGEKTFSNLANRLDRVGVRPKEIGTHVHIYEVKNLLPMSAHCDRISFLFDPYIPPFLFEEIMMDSEDDTDVALAMMLKYFLPSAQKMNNLGRLEVVAVTANSEAHVAAWIDLLKEVRCERLIVNPRQEEDYNWGYSEHMEAVWEEKEQRQRRFKAIVAATGVEEGKHVFQTRDGEIVY